MRPTEYEKDWARSIYGDYNLDMEGFVVVVSQALADYRGDWRYKVVDIVNEYDDCMDDDVHHSLLQAVIRAFDKHRGGEHEGGT